MDNFRKLVDPRNAAPFAVQADVFENDQVDDDEKKNEGPVMGIGGAPPVFRSPELNLIQLAKRKELATTKPSPMKLTAEKTEGILGFINSLKSRKG